MHTGLPRLDRAIYPFRLHLGGTAKIDRVQCIRSRVIASLTEIEGCLFGSRGIVKILEVLGCRCRSTPKIACGIEGRRR